VVYFTQQIPEDLKLFCYARKAKKAYQLIVAGEEIGPVQRKLEQFSPLLTLVFGAFAEGSEGVHELVKILADTRLRRQGAARGREGSQQELAILTGQIQRLLSMAVVGANATCLLSRINQVGELGSSSLQEEGDIKNTGGQNET